MTDNFFREIHETDRAMMTDDGGDGMAMDDGSSSVGPMMDLSLTDSAATDTQPDDIYDML